MEKIALVTGANGFIGSHLSCFLVEKGFKVYAIHRKDISKNPKFMEYKKQGKIISFLGDVSNFDYSSVPKVNYIYHIAGKVSVYGPMKEFMKINYEGTQNILNYAQKMGVECFTYFSSTAVYGYYGYQNLPEEAEKKPFKNPYSISKLKTENLVKDFCFKNKIDYVIIRPGNVYGEYDYTSSHEIYTRIKKEKMMICAGGKYKSCFVYVQNLVDAVLYVSTKKEFRNTDYNITDGQNETLKEMFTSIAKTFNVRPKFTNFPAPIAKCVASLVEGVYKLFFIKKAPLITRFSIWQNCADYNFSIKKLLNTGFKPEVSMQDGIKRTCDWILSLEDKNGTKK
ncbi:MAG: NAD(P)-dependent oxidoreductase [Clostridia bacterium]|nr:NAD(P)-dependent oxidoreductase [Clostridia bacterium]